MKMLQRIYGTCWRNKKELDEYLLRLEEAEKRDHRKLGKEMDLFHFREEVQEQFFGIIRAGLYFKLLLVI